MYTLYMVYYFIYYVIKYIPHIINIYILFNYILLNIKIFYTF